MDYNAFLSITTNGNYKFDSSLKSHLIAYVGEMLESFSYTEYRGSVSVARL